MQFLMRAANHDDVAELVALRSTSAAADHFDPDSTMESLPDVDALRRTLDASSGFWVVESDNALVGYASVRWWDEETNTRVVLCDWYLDPDHQALNGAVLERLEVSVHALGVHDETTNPTVLGVNASSVQAARADAIAAAGYELTFEQVEMELGDREPAGRALPEGLTIRNVVVEDAEALIGLTARVWAGRAYFTMPTVEEFDAWLRTSDLGLFEVVIHDGELVGFVAGVRRGSVGELDDVQVDPRLQRRGIASALVVRCIGQLRSRGCSVLRLNTEGHDPAGARSLYERLGFRVVRSYSRYRKPLR